jgi:hypothetical protein
MFLLCCFFSSVVMFVHVSSENLSSFGNSSVRIRCSSDSERPRSAPLIRTWCSRDSECVSSEEIRQLCRITRTRVIGAGQGVIGVYGRKQPRHRDQGSTLKINAYFSIWQTTVLILLDQWRISCCISGHAPVQQRLPAILCYHLHSAIHRPSNKSRW